MYDLTRPSRNTPARGGEAHAERDRPDAFELEPRGGGLRFLAEASRQLANSLDYETTLRTVGRLVVPRLADWCAIDLLEPDQSVRRVAVVDRDSRGPAVVRDREPCERPRGTPPHLLAAVLHSGRSEPYAPVRCPEQDSGTSLVPQHGVHTIDLDSGMAVPLVSRGRSLGVMWLLSAVSRHRYGPADLALADDFAARAATALDNARLVGELRAILQARNELLATLAHDLLSPLTVVKGRAQLLSRQSTQDPKRPLDPRALGQVVEAADLMAGLVRQILDASRSEAGQGLPLNIQSVDLKALVARLVERHEATSTRHMLRLSYADPGPIVGRWDAGRLERVIDNLLSNAIKYSPAGGEVAVIVARREPWAVLRVRDHGLGIPSADLPHVFERFRRGANVAGRIAGYGIGLAGVRRIVREHGGHVSVESVQDKGTAVTVWLPLVGGPTGDDAPASRRSTDETGLR